MAKLSQARKALARLPELEAENAALRAEVARLTPKPVKAATEKESR